MTAEEKEVLAAFEEMQQAMIDKNIEKMRELTVPEKMFTHMSGNIAFPALPMKITFWKISQFSISN